MIQRSSNVQAVCHSGATFRSNPETMAPFNRRCVSCTGAPWVPGSGCASPGMTFQVSFALKPNTTVIPGRPSGRTRKPWRRIKAAASVALEHHGSRVCAHAHPGMTDQGCRLATDLNQTPLSFRGDPQVEPGNHGAVQTPLRQLRWSTMGPGSALTRIPG